MILGGSLHQTHTTNAGRQMLGGEDSWIRRDWQSEGRKVRQRRESGLVFDLGGSCLSYFLSHKEC